VVTVTIRHVGTMAMFVGLGLLAWCGTVYFWKDPFTTAYTAFEQRRLGQAFDRRVETWSARASDVASETSRPRPGNIRRDARAYRSGSGSGDAVARIEIPKLGLDVVVVNGTDASALRRGPGRHLDTFMPGERELVYIAGHRTTFGAPFSEIDRLRPGDRVVVEVPYATFEYRVTGHRIVDQYEVSVLRTRGREELALQACHPRFFASQRYIVYARPVRVSARIGRD
jgi:sortase A